MFPRELEPEVMDAPDEARDYDAMDAREVNDQFVADFLAMHGPCRGGTVLDVCTGTALIPIALCLANRAARVLGIDLAKPMIDLARQNVEAAGLSERIAIHEADAKNVGPGYAHFEAVISNGSLHHIPEPLVAMREMARLVAPGGDLFVRDLARPDHPDDADRLVAEYAPTASELIRAKFAASFRAAMTVDEMRELLSELDLPGSSIEMTSDRHWTWTWKRP